MSMNVGDGDFGACHVNPVAALLSCLWVLLCSGDAACCPIVTENIFPRFSVWGNRFVSCLCDGWFCS